MGSNESMPRSKFFTDADAVVIDPTNGGFGSMRDRIRKLLAPNANLLLREHDVFDK
jgi:hypothetical protein